MSDIFQEVDEALQQEKIAKIWQEYQTPILSAIGILILGTAAFTGVKNWNYTKNTGETKNLLSAIESPKAQDELQNFAKDTRNNHAAVAKLNLAQLLIEEGKTKEAANIYKEIAQNRGVDHDLRDLSRILFARNSDKADKNILIPVLSNEKSPWKWHARLEMALIEAHQNNDLETAISLLEPFQNDATIPASLKQRANALSGVYSYKLQNSKPE